MEAQALAFLVIPLLCYATTIAANTTNTGLPKSFKKFVKDAVKKGRPFDCVRQHVETRYEHMMAAVGAE